MRLWFKKKAAPAVPTKPAFAPVRVAKMIEEECAVFAKHPRMIPVSAHQRARRISHIVAARLRAEGLQVPPDLIKWVPNALA